MSHLPVTPRRTESKEEEEEEEDGDFGVREGIACRALVGCGGGVEVETAVPSSKSYHRAEEAQTFIFPP